MWSAWRLTLVCVCLASPLRPRPCRADGPAVEAAEAAFRRLDQDSDSRLSREELCGDLRDSALVEGQRQFRMFDFDADGFLTLREFRNVPMFIVASERGPLIDPLVDRADQAAETLARRWAALDRDGDGSLSAKEFASGGVAAIIPGLMDSTFGDWDRDADGGVTAAEGEMVAEIAYGVRRPQGDLLRLRQGASISWLGFKEVDKDHDGRINRDEADRGYDGALNAARFAESDKNADGFVSFEEWSLQPYRIIDPFGLFLRCDVDMSGRLSRKELIAGTSEWQRPLGHYVLPAFDDDGDGELSFQEFLATPLACQQQSWHVSRPDLNADGRLDFTEFRWSQGIDAASLQSEYFRRFDVNGDGALTIDEFFFQTAWTETPDVFRAWDEDGNGSISSLEFEARSPVPTAGLRDFHVFDLDQDGVLSAEEFATVPSIVHPSRRGPLKDPFDDLFKEHLAPLQAALLRIGAGRQTTGLDLNRAVTEAWEIRPLAVPPELQMQSDRDRRFSEEQLAATVRTALGIEIFGARLREPAGPVTNLMLFRNMDADNDWRVTQEEYQGSPFTAAVGPQAFALADRNGDRQLTPEEWRNVPGLGQIDPVTEFLHLDEDFDGRVSPRELVERCPSWKRRMAKTMFPGFDADRDGFMSLAEYRLTPIAFPILEWQTEIADPDNNGQLTLSEFQYRNDPFLLLRRAYLQRLDLNGNGALDAGEFPFRTMTPDTFYVMNADGTGWRKLFRFEGHQACGSPTVSPDGKTIAFDAWTVLPQRSPPEVCLVNIDGSEPRVLMPGQMPSFSPDGQRFTFSANGVCVANRKGVIEKSLSEKGAWGCQWSGDGQSIAFCSERQLVLVDTASEQVRTVIGGRASPFVGFYWNLAWSPDSRRLCTKTTTAEGLEQIVIVDALGAEFGIKSRYIGRDIDPDFAWHPDGQRIVFSRYCPERARLQLYEFSADGDEAPTLMPGQCEDTSNASPCWTPDGRTLIVVVGDY